MENDRIDECAVKQPLMRVRQIAAPTSQFTSLDYDAMNTLTTPRGLFVLFGCLLPGVALAAAAAAVCSTWAPTPCFPKVPA